MRVLQVMAGARHGGAEAFFTRLVPALARAGLDQHAAIRRNPARAAALRAAGVPVTELRFGGRLDLATGPRLRRLAAAFRPAIVLSWMNRASRAVPAGAYVHVGRLGGYYDLKYYRRCDWLVANTEDIADYVIDAGWPRDRVRCLPNFVADAASPPASRAELDTPEDAPLLLALGRLHRNKAFDVLIEALAALPGVWLWLAGAGPEESALRAAAARLGVAERLRFLGWREDAPALLAACDVFVCPSRHEPLGNVVIEAWAQRRPVVAAAAQGPRALIEDGETGLLAPVDDADALARAIRRLIDDPAFAAGLARAGRAAFEARFSEPVVIGRWLDFFAEVAG